MGLGRKLLNILGDSLIIAFVPVILLMLIEHNSLADAVGRIHQLLMLPLFFFAIGVIIVVSQWGGGAIEVFRGKRESIDFERIENDVDVIGWLVRGLTTLFAGFFSLNVIIQRLIRAFS